MRTIRYSKEFNEFFDTLPDQVKEKTKYALQVIMDMKIISSKLAKKLIGTDFYELRISMQDEWRIVMLPMDNESLIECSTIMLLNGFKKKSTKDYRREINKAKSIFTKELRNGI